MTYDFKIINKKEFHFVRTKVQGCLGKFIAILGVFVVSIFVLFYFKDCLGGMPDEFATAFLQVFLIIGVLFIIGGVLAPRFQRYLQPQKFIFNSEKGYIEIIGETKISKQRAYIPFTEIAKIDYRKVKSSGSSDSYSFHLYFQKKDGGCWDLYSSGGETHIIMILAQVNELVKLSVVPEGKLKPNLPHPLKLKQIKGKEAIVWQNRITSYQMMGVFVFFMVLTVFFMVFRLLYTGMSLGKDAFFFVFLSIMAAGFVFIIIKVALNIFKFARGKYALLFSEDFLEYQMFDKGDQINKSTQIRLSDIHAVVYNFSLDHESNTLYFLSEEDMKARKTDETDPTNLIDYITSMSTKKDLLSIILNDLNAISMLQLENYVQEKINKSSRNERPL